MPSMMLLSPTRARQSLSDALETLSLEVRRAAAGTNRAPRPCQHPAAPLHLRRPLSSPRPPPVPLAQVAASVTSGGELWQEASSTNSLAWPRAFAWERSKVGFADPSSPPPDGRRVRQAMP